jgi:hypothetical protein
MLAASRLRDGSPGASGVYPHVSSVPRQPHIRRAAVACPREQPDGSVAGHGVDGAKRSPRQGRAGFLAAFLLHTCVAYTCALQLSRWLVFHWFGWVMPILNISASTPATDWYLQHFERMTIPPAVLVAYVNVACFLPNTIRNFMQEDRHSIAPWAWIFPTLVLSYRMLEYHAPSSVLWCSSMTAAKYFFEMVKVMPTVQNPLASDPIRAWAQMSVTAPFCAGVAYSLGALASQHKVMERTFTFEKHDEATADHDPGV